MARSAPRHPRWTRRFLDAEDFDVITDAIFAAEARTSGEIRVHLERRVPRARGGEPGDTLARARAVFHHLEMHRKSKRHGVLIYLAVEDRKLAIIGDEGIHQRVGDDYWARVRDLMVHHLKRGAPRQAIVEAVAEIGRGLAEHFPLRADDPPPAMNDLTVG